MGHPCRTGATAPVLQPVTENLRALGLLADPAPADLDLEIRNALRLLADIAGFRATEDLDEAVLQLATARTIIAAARTGEAASLIPPETPDIVLLMFREAELGTYAELVTSQVSMRLSRTIKFTTTTGLTIFATFAAEKSTTPCSTVTADLLRGDIQHTIPQSRICNEEPPSRMPRYKATGLR